MRRETFLATTIRRACLLSLMVFACIASARAQLLIPRVCVEPTYRTGTVTLAADAAEESSQISVNDGVPQLVSLVINPGGANEERVPVNRTIAGDDPYTLRLETGKEYSPPPPDTNGLEPYRLAHAHRAGETIRFEGNSGITAYFGYYNKTNETITVQKGPSGGNFFFPGQPVYPEQISEFLPGIHDNAFSIQFPSDESTYKWVLLDQGVQVLPNGRGQDCGTITYQGRLTDANTAANGQYDLRFTLYDTLSGGEAQSDVVTVESAQVTNGIFTASLNFFAAFINNDKARFLEIGVRRGAASGNAPFTILTPRQPITFAPFAANAMNAFDIRLPTIDSDCLNNNTTTSNIGQMRVDATNNRLYVCTTTGWKSTALQ